MAVYEYAWQTCRSAHTDPSTSCWNLFTDSADQSIMSSLSLAHTLFGATYLCRCPHNTQNVVNPTWIVRAEGKKKRKHISYCLCIRNTHTHKHKHKHTKDKAQRKKFNRGLVPNCKREAAVTASKEQVSQIFLSTGMICSVSSSFGYSSQLLRPSQLSLCVSCCFARLLFLLKSVELSWCL